MQQKKGFTLIELLVVIAIIGILSAIGLVSLNGAREKARDSKRKTDLATISTALQLYYDDQATAAYPTTAGAAGTADAISTNLATLVPNYVNALPTLPSGSTGGAGGMSDYFYRTNGTTSQTIATKVYGTDQLFWLASKLEGGTGDYYLLNNLGFAGNITSDTDTDTVVKLKANILCADETNTLNKIDGCSRTPSNN